MVVLKKLRQERDEQLAEAFALANACSNGMLAFPEITRRSTIRKKHILAVDKHLHQNPNGPFYLTIPEVAREVIDSYLFLFKRKEIYLYAICIMPNHIHVVLDCPDGKQKVDIGKLMQRTKRHTAKEANKILGRTGQPFWDDDYFDVTVRRTKFYRVMWYVLNNPVKAGFVGSWVDWPHTWVNPDYRNLFVER